MVLRIVIADDLMVVNDNILHESPTAPQKYPSLETQGCKRPNSINKTTVLLRDLTRFLIWGRGRGIPRPWSWLGG